MAESGTGSADRCLAALRASASGPATLASMFAATAARRGEAVFLRCRERAHSWKEAQDLTEAWAIRLAALGCRPGDRVAFLGPNSDLTVLLLLACAKARVGLSVLDGSLSAPDIARRLEVARPVLVIADGSTAARLGEAVGRWPVRALDDVLPSRPPPVGADRASEARPTDALAVVFTSGTTGEPKAALHSNATYAAAAQIAAFRMRLGPDDRVLCMLPLSHLNALFYSVGGAIAVGAELVIEERFSASTFWQTVARYGITQVNMIAAIGNILLRRPREEFPVSTPLRKISAAPVGRAMADALLSEFGVETVVESYGMTEIPGIAQVDFDDREHRACLGRPIRHPLTGEPVSEIRLVDPEFRDVPPGAVGRVLVRASTVMLGYIGDPERTAASFRGPWFVTNDLAREEEGFYYFAGRMSDQIRRRGENVSASALEAVLMDHPAVSEAACLGVPSDLGEEEIVAVVTPRAPGELDLGELHAFCRARLRRAEVPRFYVRRSDLPKTATEKVQRHRLRDDPGLLDGAFDAEANSAPASAEADRALA